MGWWGREGNMLVGKEPLLFLSEPSTLALALQPYQPQKFLFIPSRLEKAFSCMW